MKTERHSQTTILIVNDDIAGLMILRSVVSKGGYSVLAAENGPDAVKIARTLSPDVAILDMVNSDRDGTEVANALRQDPKTESIPIIFLSTLVAAEAMRNKVENDPISYLSKPCNQGRLLNEIGRHLVMKDKSQ